MKSRSASVRVEPRTRSRGQAPPCRCSRMSGEDTVTSTWRAFGPNSAALGRFVLSTQSKSLLKSSKRTSAGDSTPVKGPRLPNTSTGFPSLARRTAGY